MCLCHCSVAEGLEDNFSKHLAVHLLIAVAPQSADYVINIVNVLDQQDPVTRQQESADVRDISMSKQELQLA